MCYERSGINMIGAWIAVLLILFASMFVGKKEGFWKTVLSLILILLFLFVMGIVTPKAIEFFLNTDIISEKIVSEDGVDSEALLEKLPEDLRDKLLGDNETFDEMMVNDIRQALNSMGIIFLCTLLISLIVILLIAKLILKPIDVSFNLISKLPVIGKADKFLGMLLGIPRAMIIIWVLMAGISMIELSLEGSYLVGWIYQSKILTWLYENNYIINYIF